MVADRPICILLGALGGQGGGVGRHRRRGRPSSRGPREEDRRGRRGRQRRLRGENAKKLEAGNRVELPRFGIDDEVCTGDHSCMRLNGCPSLTLKVSSDPFKETPVAHVNDGCVACGHCGEVAHAAQLCPSFYKAEAIRNPGALRTVFSKINRSLLTVVGA